MCENSGTCLELEVTCCALCGTHMNTQIYNGDLLEGAAQAGVETIVGPQPFML